MAGFAAVLEVRFLNRVRFEPALIALLTATALVLSALLTHLLTVSLALSALTLLSAHSPLALLTAASLAFASGLFVAAVLVVLAFAFAALPSSATLFVALCAVLTLLAAHLLAVLLALLPTHLLAVLLAAHLTTLASLTLLPHLLLIPLTASRLRRPVVTGFAAVLEVRFPDGVGLESALIALLTATALALSTSLTAHLLPILLTAHLTALSTLTTAVHPLRAALTVAGSLTALLPARLLAVPPSARSLLVALAAVSLPAAGLLAATLSTVAAVGTAPPAGVVAGLVGLRFGPVPLVAPVSIRTVRADVLAPAAAVQAVDPAALVGVLRSIVVRSVGASVSPSVAVVSVVHGCVSWKL